MLDIGSRRGIDEKLPDPGEAPNHFYLEGIEPDARESEAILARGFYSKVHRWQ